MIQKNFRFVIILFVILFGGGLIVYGVNQSENFYGKIKRPLNLSNNSNDFQNLEKAFNQPFIDSNSVSGAVDLRLDGVPVVSEVLDERMSLLGYQYSLRIRNDSQALAKPFRVELYFDDLNVLLGQQVQYLDPDGLQELIFFDNSLLPIKRGENSFQVRIDVASLNDEIDYANNFSNWKFFVSDDGRPNGIVQAISN